MTLQRHSRIVVVHLGFLELGRTATYSTFAAHDAGRRQEQQRRGHQQQDPEPGKDANHLRPVPHDRGPRVAQFILAGTLVVMPQQEVIV